MCDPASNKQKNLQSLILTPPNLKRNLTIKFDGFLLIISPTLIQSQNVTKQY